MSEYLLLILLFTAHFFGDFTQLSTIWMLSAKTYGKPWFPIFCHALVHSVLMATVLEIWYYANFDNYNPLALEYTKVDTAFLLMFGTHFLIDVTKGFLNLKFPLFRSTTKYPHWWLFGGDQLAHAIVIITIFFHITK